MSCDLSSAMNINDCTQQRIALGAGSGSRPSGFGVPGVRGGARNRHDCRFGIDRLALGIDPRLLISGAEILSGGGSSYQQPYPGSERGSAPSSEAARTGSRTFSTLLGSSESCDKRTSYTLIESAKLNKVDRLGSPMCSNGSCRRDLVHVPNAEGSVLRSPRIVVTY